MNIFDANALLNSPPPDDISLAEFRAVILASGSLKELAGATKKRFRVRFLRTADQSELLDTMTLGAFRALSKLGLTIIAIDDGGFGVRKREVV